MDKSSDSELIRDIQRGNREAFEMLVKRHYQQAFSTAFSWIHNREAALDISQEAFIRVQRHIRRFDAERSFPAWLYTIVRNLCRNHATRHRKRWVVFSDAYHSGVPAEEALASPGASSDGTGNDQIERLWKAIHRLAEKDRAIILLRDIEEFSYREIAQALDIPEGTVMSRLYHARKRLVLLLSSIGPESEV